MVAGSKRIANWMLATVSLLTLFALPTCASAAGKPVVVFALRRGKGGERPGVPMIDPIVILKGGSFEKLPMDMRGEDESNAAFKLFENTYYKRGQKYPLINHGSRDGVVSVGVPTDISCISWTATATPDRQFANDSPRLVVTSDRGVGLHPDLDSRASDSQRHIFRNLAAAYFRKRLRDLKTSDVQVENVQSVFLSRDFSALAGNAVVKRKDGVYRLFALAGLGKKPALRLASYRVAKDLEDGTDSVAEYLVDHSDLDNDGTDEIITISYYYESWDYTVYKQVGGKWQSVYHGAGGGC